MANYTNFWGAWQEHQTASVDGNLNYAAMTMSVKPYHALQTGINEYGDILTPRIYPTYKNTEKNKKITTNLINSQRAVALNAVNKKIKATGAVLTMSFCTKDRIGYQYDWTADADAATKTYAELLDIPIISNIGTFVFENELMYDSQWHTNFKGANKRTYELSFDIKQFLLGDGKDSYMSYSKRVIHEKNDFPNSFDQEEN
jgi:hypothetical protein